MTLQPMPPIKYNLVYRLQRQTEQLKRGVVLLEAMKRAITETKEYPEVKKCR